MPRALALLVLSLLAACVEPGLPGAEGDAGAGVDAGPYRCSPMTCTGCCRNNVCRGGNEDEACGYDGRLCRECATDAVCVAPGTCVGRPRDGGGPGSDGGSGGTLQDPYRDAPIPPLSRCTWVFGVPLCG